MSEMVILKQAQMQASKFGLRLFRNNTGSLKDATGRWVQFGLCEGSSDLIGFTPIAITPEMVGMKLAVFTAIEIKEDGKKTKPERLKKQLHFISQVNEYGGIAFILNDASKLGDILTRTLKLMIDSTRATV